MWFLLWFYNFTLQITESHSSGQAVNWQLRATNSTGLVEKCPQDNEYLDPVPSKGPSLLLLQLHLLQGGASMAVPYFSRKPTPGVVSLPSLLLCPLRYLGQCRIFSCCCFIQTGVCYICILYIFIGINIYYIYLICIYNLYIYKIYFKNTVLIKQLHNRHTMLLMLQTLFIAHKKLVYR